MRASARRFIFVAGFAVLFGRSAFAQSQAAEPPDAGLAASAAEQQGARDCNGFFSCWFERSDKAKATQPRWMTPLVTVTPRLEQEFRYDIAWQGAADGTTTVNYGFNKGIELIPTSNTEVILIAPPYIVHHEPAVHDGSGDAGILVKFRMLSGDEQHGNYIVTFFYQMSFPSGSYSNGAAHAVITPTLAYGKGWGRWDVQGTLGSGIPVVSAATLGTPVNWNNAVQWHPSKLLWPELEANTTFFPNGKNSGQEQVFLTPGLILGRFPLSKRFRLVFGAGYQIAVTHFHTNNHNVILTVRFPF